MATAKRKPRRSRVSGEAKAYMIGLAQQRWADIKERLFDDYDYDRISRSEYDQKLREAHQEFRDEVKRIKSMK